MQRRSFLFAALTPLAVRLQAAERAGELPFRQIHLDFHTSELIPDVGADWSTDDFVRTLTAARVNSVNVFAKGHHGMAYYNTKIAIRHPSLKFDLLGEMVRGCRGAGIAINYYYSLVWDVAQSRRHPEWLSVDRSGNHIGGVPTDQWPWLCMNSPYLDHVIAENREILANYQVDGGWFDILKQPPEGCFCRWCIAERKKLGLTDSPEDTFKHNKLVAKRVEDVLSRLVHEHYPKAATFFNSRLVIGVRDELPYYSHIEIESLPTGGWGYSHFQQRVRYMRTLGKDLVGMTGRFHRSWGDFGGFKNQAALDFECLNFLANGTKVCVGDQLHPRGRLDPITYRRIGSTYRRIEALEPWARGTRAVADIGVISAAATNPDMATQKLPVVDQGFTNMLIELHQQFDVLDTGSDLSAYKLVVVPDEIRPVPELMAKLEQFVSRGGALIVSDRSLLDGNRFALKGMGVRYLGPAKFNGEYMLLGRDAFPSIDDAPYFLYRPGVSIEAEPGTEVLATYGHPYFDRSPEHFSSHKQTPLGTRTTEPLITRRGRVVYIANPFFRSYAQDGYGVQKLVVRDLVRMLLPAPAVIAPELPSTAQITVLQQQQPSRTIVHVLHYPLTRRAPDIDIIEEAGRLASAELRVRAPKPRRVAAIPQNSEIVHQYANGYVRFATGDVTGHAAFVIE